MADFLFDKDTRDALTAAGDGRWTVRVSPLWNIAGVPNGGFLMALCLAAAGEQVSQPDPVSMSSHFLGRTMPGEAAIRSRVVKRGRTLSVTSVDLIQNDRVSVTSLITWGDLPTLRGPTGPLLEPPDLPPESGMLGDPPLELDSTFPERFEYLVPHRIAMGAAGRPTGKAEAKGLMRFADGRPPDLLSMPLVADGFPPAIFQLGHYGWAPTLELTLHFRARPQPGWLTIDLKARHLLDGTFDEDCNVWDSQGNLIAMSRQLGRTMAG